MIKYIKDSVQNSKKQERSFSVYGTPVEFINPFEKKINFNSVFSSIENLLPQKALEFVDIIYIANMKEFSHNDRSYNAMYKDNAIYISPEQDSEFDLLDDIIHEIAHSLENKYQNIIFGDDELEREFLGKRRTLFFLVDKPALHMFHFENPDYSGKFDNFLYKDVGYEKLRLISAELFYSPYAITSLREYWANGFENYLLGDRQALKDLCPVLFSKIEELFEEIRNEF